jgi:hypothetical protein
MKSCVTITRLKRIPEMDSSRELYLNKRNDYVSEDPRTIRSTPRSRDDLLLLPLPTVVNISMMIRDWPFRIQCKRRAMEIDV